jgi:hypothetical protein
LVRPGHGLALFVTRDLPPWLTALDDAVVQVVLEAVTPAALEVPLEVFDEPWARKAGGEEEYRNAMTTDGREVTADECARIPRQPEVTRATARAW